MADESAHNAPKWLTSCAVRRQPGDARRRVRLAIRQSGQSLRVLSAGPGRFARRCLGHSGCDKVSPTEEKPMSWKAASAFIAITLALAAPAHAQSVEDFYRNRTITILVGFTAGG